MARHASARIDNEIYDHQSGEWWDERGGLYLLKTVVNPWRVPYFARILSQWRIDPRGARALDVGCGGGLLAEEFAAMGCAVTGIDPSEGSLAVARAHAAANGLRIEYRHGFGDALPFADESFAIAYCCDVLEHIHDWDAVIGEMARVLTPRGLLFFDTVNRTILSNAVVIKLLQEWRYTSVFPPRFHMWEMFITPRELRASLERHGLRPRDITGAAVKIDPVQMLRAMRRYKAGMLAAAEVGKHITLREGPRVALSYMGYASKE
jgi:2-polyprenyl-6-hydroxyphenyl methylase/3-demethylubiquinone-9 3-methyltransferase